MRTLNSIFDELKIKNIDFVSLDIEGYEVQALLGLDFTKYKPSIFVIEYKDDIHQQQLESILFPQGYYYLSIVGCNLVYSLNAKDRKVLMKGYGKVNLLLVDQAGVKQPHEVIFSEVSLINNLKMKFKQTTIGKRVLAVYRSIRKR